MTSGNGNAPDPRVATLPYATPNIAPSLPFPDQRGGLKTMGIIMIVLGCFSGCMAAVTPMTLMLPRMTGQPAPAARDLVGGIVVYALGALLLITLGAGSMRLKRWSRPLIMIFMGTVAAFGAISFIVFLFMGPAITRAMSSAAATASAPAPTTTATATTGPTTAPMIAAAVPTSGQFLFGMVVGGCFMLVFAVVLPAGFFWFYKRESVQQTLDHFAPGTGWTDRCPTPILAVSLWLAAGAVLTLSYCTWAICPAFGVLLQGAPAIGMLIAATLIQLLLARGVYRVSPAAWWATTLFIALASASMLVTYVSVDPIEIYKATASSPQQVEMMQKMSIGRPGLIAPIALNAVAMLGYMLWARRFLDRPAVAV